MGLFEVGNLSFPSLPFGGRKESTEYSWWRPGRCVSILPYGSRLPYRLPPICISRLLGTSEKRTPNGQSIALEFGTPRTTSHGRDSPARRGVGQRRAGSAPGSAELFGGPHDDALPRGQGWAKFELGSELLALAFAMVTPTNNYQLSGWSQVQPTPARNQVEQRKLDAAARWNGNRAVQLHGCNQPVVEPVRSTCFTLRGRR